MAMSVQFGARESLTAAAASQEAQRRERRVSGLAATSYGALNDNRVTVPPNRSRSCPATCPGSDGGEPRTTSPWRSQRVPLPRGTPI